MWSLRETIMSEWSHALRNYLRLTLESVITAVYEREKSRNDGNESENRVEWKCILKYKTRSTFNFWRKSRAFSWNWIRNQYNNMALKAFRHIARVDSLTAFYIPVYDRRKVSFFQICYIFIKLFKDPTTNIISKLS